MFRRTRGSPRPKPWLLLAAIVRSAAAFGFGNGATVQERIAKNTDQMAADIRAIRRDGTADVEVLD